MSKVGRPDMQIYFCLFIIILLADALLYQLSFYHGTMGLVLMLFSEIF